MQVKVNDDYYDVNNLYYISPNGDDENDGLTRETALKTFKKAESLCGEGDAIEFLKGNYYFTYNDFYYANNEGYNGSDYKYKKDNLVNTTNACFTTYNKNIIIYSKSVKKNTINININTQFAISRPSLFNLYEGNKVINLNIKYSNNKISNNQYENNFIGDRCYGSIENCVFILNPKSNLSMVYSNPEYPMTISNCVFINNNWFSNNYSGNGKVVNNCVFSKNPPSTFAKYNNCLIKEDITENNVYDTFYLDNIQVGLLFKSYNCYILNNNNKYIINEYNYDTTTKMYTPVSGNISSSTIEEAISDDLFENVTYGTGTENEETFKPIDKFTGDIQLIADSNDSYYIQGIKSSKELVVAKDDFNNGLAETINSITLNDNVSGNGNIKMAVSIDKGKNWLTYNSKDKWKNLNITIPTTIYADMNESEKLQWNNAMDVIAENGLTVGEINSLDYNSFADGTPEDIRFAYVLIKPTYNDNVSTTALDWNFKAKGTMRLMIPGTEYDVDVSDRSVSFTPHIQNEMIKVNLFKET